MCIAVEGEFSLAVCHLSLHLVFRDRDFVECIIPENPSRWLDAMQVSGPNVQTFQAENLR